MMRTLIGEGGKAIATAAADRTDEFPNKGVHVSFLAKNAKKASKKSP